MFNIQPDPLCLNKYIKVITSIVTIIVINKNINKKVVIMSTAAPKKKIKYKCIYDKRV